jgi:RNA polymerase sigma-70 factor (ECF subfamily)
VTSLHARAWPSERVIDAAQKGDPTALTTLLSGSHPHVQRFARALCSTPEDAEDAAQEALIVLYRRIGTLRATGALASWMFRIVRNECIRRSRITGNRMIPEPRSLSGRGAQSSAEEAVLEDLELKRIIQSIAALPSEQRAVLIMRDVQGLSGAATAQALGLSRAAMKSRLHRGRETLRSQLRAERRGATNGDADA